jgi:hypothetical protein
MKLAVGCISKWLGKMKVLLVKTAKEQSIAGFKANGSGNVQNAVLELL